MRTIDTSIQQRVELMPEFLSISAKYAGLAGALKLIPADKCIVYATEEATKEFGKCYKQNIMVQLKKLGIKKPRVAVQSGKVYVYKVEV